MERAGKDLKTETDMMNELPREASDRVMTLASMLFEAANSFIKSHSLKLSMPEEGSISRALTEGNFLSRAMIETRLLRNTSHPDDAPTRHRYERIKLFGEPFTFVISIRTAATCSG